MELGFYSSLFSVNVEKSCEQSWFGRMWSKKYAPVQTDDVIEEEKKAKTFGEIVNLAFNRLFCFIQLVSFLLCTIIFLLCVIIVILQLKYENAVTKTKQKFLT